MAREQLIVYLDSSDYSFASGDSDHLTPEAREYRDFLERCASSGRVVFPFSAVHVLEGAHLQPVQRKYGRERAEFIKSLSRDHSLLFPIDLMSSETIAAVRATGEYVNVLSEQGEWWPKGLSFSKQLSQFLGPEFDKELRQAIGRHVEGAPRNVRRTLRSRCLKNGRLTAQGRKLIQADSESLCATLVERFGFPESPSRDLFIKALIAGHAPADDLSRKFEEEFLDVSRFIGWYMDAYDEQRKIVKWLRGFNETIVSIMRQLQNKFLELKPTAKEVASLPAFDSAVRSGILKGVIGASSEPEIKKLARDDVIELADNLAGSSYASGINTIASAVDAWVKANLNNLLNPRNVKDSDGADLLHSIYLPYVDVFRCDKFMSTQFSAISESHRTAICSTRKQLVDVISEATGVR